MCGLIWLTVQTTAWEDKEEPGKISVANLVSIDIPKGHL
jgi:hypothetical protein